MKTIEVVAAIIIKDSNLVSALTSHVEGSRAFIRYRTIDIDMKKDLVKILEGNGKWYC